MDMTAKKQWISMIDRRIGEYRKNGLNKFSSTEAMLVALLHPDLHPKLMPEEFQHDPLGAQLKLEQWQRNFIWNRRSLC
jgi:hypothetical protein